MLEKIVRGGQTGADQAGWRAARTCGLATGGWMPRDFLTKDGPRPEFADLYGARELPTDEYPPRTLRNAQDSDATRWFGDTATPGARTTLAACRELGRPCMLVLPGDMTRLPVVVDWITGTGIRAFNVAGNRESIAPGIGQSVERFLVEIFSQLGLGPKL